jgi:hypothetical protein
LPPFRNEKLAQQVVVFERPATIPRARFAATEQKANSYHFNPFYHGRGIFAYDATKHGQTKIAPSDFTIGSRLVMGGKLREALVGDMAGLAVFSRALSDQEMKTLHAAAHR